MEPPRPELDAKWNSKTHFFKIQFRPNLPSKLAKSANKNIYWQNFDMGIIRRKIWWNLLKRNAKKFTQKLKTFSSSKKNKKTSVLCCFLLITYFTFFATFSAFCVLLKPILNYLEFLSTKQGFSLLSSPSGSSPWGRSYLILFWDILHFFL